MGGGNKTLDMKRLRDLLGSFSCAGGGPDEIFPPALEKIMADTHVIKDFTNRLVDNVLDALGPVIK